MEIDEEVWNHATFSKNRERMLNGDDDREFFYGVTELARKQKLLSYEHFTVDGTLLEAWTSQKSFRRKDGEEPPSGKARDFRGEHRGNETHQSTPEARLYRRTHHGEANLSYLGHVLIENRNGLAVSGCVTQANSYAERDAALAMLEELPVLGLAAYNLVRIRGLGWQRENRLPPGRGNACRGSSGKSDFLNFCPPHFPMVALDSRSIQIRGFFNSRLGEFEKALD